MRLLLAFTRGARTKASVTDSEREGRLAQAGAVGVQCLIGQLRAAIESKVEPGEDPRDALARELKEELGIDAEVGDPLEITYHRYPTKSVLLLFFEAKLRAGSPPPSAVDVAAVRWASVDELRDEEFPPADVASPPPPRSGDVPSPLATNADVSSGFFALRFFFLARGAVLSAHLLQGLIRARRSVTARRSASRPPDAGERCGPRRLIAASTSFAKLYGNDCRNSAATLTTTLRTSDDRKPPPSGTKMQHATWLAVSRVKRAYSVRTAELGISAVGSMMMTMLAEPECLAANALATAHMFTVAGSVVAPRQTWIIVRSQVARQ